MNRHSRSAPGTEARDHSGKPQFFADLPALFETRLWRTATRGKRGEAITLLREVLGDKRAAASAVVVIPEESVTPEAPAEMPETPEESGTGGEPGADVEPEGRLS